MYSQQWQQQQQQQQQLDGQQMSGVRLLRE